MSFINFTLTKSYSLMKRNLLLLALLSPITSLAQLQIGANTGGALNAYDYTDKNKTGCVYKANVAYKFSKAVKAGLGYRHTNALDKDINSVFAFADFGGHVGKLEVYAGPELGYFPYHATYQLQYANTMRPIEIFGFGIETGAHAGCNYFFSKAFGLNAQIGYVGSSIKEHNKYGMTYAGSSRQMEYTTIGRYGSFELSLGMRYTITFKERKNDDVLKPD